MALLSVTALVVPVTHVVCVQEALLVLVVGSLLLWLLSLFPCLAWSALISTLHVGCLAAAPVVVARVDVARLVLLLTCAPMVLLVFPRGGSSLGILVGTCLVRLKSLCVVAVNLLLLLFLVLGQFELVFGMSSPSPLRFAVCRRLRVCPSGSLLAADRGQCCLLLLVAGSLQWQAYSLLIVDGTALH